MDKCTGCGACVEACPYHPKRLMVQPETASVYGAVSRKCDLCAQAPFHWHESGGGPEGKQACVEVCPVSAISFTRDIPVQKGDAGYQVNLRDEAWLSLGYRDIKTGE
jgi:protein NrfC